MPQIKICTAYELDGEIIHSSRPSADDLARVKPVYEVVPGGMQDTTACTCYKDLPENTRKYLDARRTGQFDRSHYFGRPQTGTDISG